MNNQISEQKANYSTLAVFAIAMGFLEAIVVVYVRELYYPGGFSFPLKALPPKIIFIELIRELSTLIMLGAVAWLAGKTFVRRLSAFIFVFGIWDIIYYVALKIFIDWPDSLFTWDILFLIPITWIGPVLAPVICSIVMIIMAFSFEYFQRKQQIQNFSSTELLLIFSGAAVIFYTFIFDFGKIIIKGNYLRDFFSLAEDSRFLAVLTTFKPVSFQWGIFTIGLLIIIVGSILVIKRALTNN